MRRLVQVQSHSSEDAVEVIDLDLEGTIISTNDAWTSFCLANDGDPQRCGPGTSWVRVSEAAGDDPWARVMLAAIEVANHGLARTPLTLTMPSHAPHEARWFDTSIGSVFDARGRVTGTRITLVPHESTSTTSRGVVPPLMPESAVPWPTLHAEMLQEFLVAASGAGRLSALLEAAVRATAADAGAIWTARVRGVGADTARPGHADGAAVGLLDGRVDFAAAAGSWSEQPAQVIEDLAGREARHILGTCEPLLRQGSSFGGEPQINDIGLVDPVDALEPTLNARRGTTLAGVPIIFTDEPLLGAILVAREGTSGSVGDSELAVLTAVACRGGPALAAATRQIRRAELRAMSDLEHLAEDLSSHVVSRLFTAAMGLEGLVASARTEAERERLLSCVAEIDEATAYIRKAVLGIR